MCFACFAIALHAQTIPASGNPNYKTFAEEGKDTLSYLTYNFYTGKSFYIGKTLSVLLGDLELPVLSCDYNINSTNIDVTEISLDIISDDEVWKRMENNGKITTLIVTFQKGISQTDIKTLLQNLKTTYPNYVGNVFAYWESLQTAFFGSQIIKELNVSTIDFKNP